MFIKCNRVLAILALLVAFDLIRRTEIPILHTWLININLHRKTPINNSQYLINFPYTLEQEVIKQMVPLVTSGKTISKPSYKPILENLYDAEYVNKTN